MNRLIFPDDSLVLLLTRSLRERETERERSFISIGVVSQCNAHSLVCAPASVRDRLRWVVLRPPPPLPGLAADHPDSDGRSVLDRPSCRTGPLIRLFLERGLHHVVSRNHVHLMFFLAEPLPKRLDWEFIRRLTSLTSGCFGFFSAFFLSFQKENSYSDGICRERMETLSGRKTPLTKRPAKETRAHKLIPILLMWPPPHVTALHFSASRRAQRNRRVQPSVIIGLTESAG